MWNATQFFRDYNIPTRNEGINCAPGWINICCPICRKGDQDFHLGFNINRSKFNCWREGSHSIVDVIKNLLNTSLGNSINIKKEYAGRISINGLRSKKKKSNLVTHIDLPGSTLKIPHRKYLQRRNFDPDHLIEKYKILGTGPKENFLKKNFQLRVIIPIIDKRGKVISFQGRDITEKQELKYKACPIDFSVKDIKQTLYNLNNCNSEIIILVEGVFDAWRIGDDCAATFGTALTDGQLMELIKYDKIFWLFDSEEAAQKKALAGANKLASLGKDVELLELEDKSRDPGEMTEDEVKQLREMTGV